MIVKNNNKNTQQQHADCDDNPREKLPLSSTGAREHQEHGLDYVKCRVRVARAERPRPQELPPAPPPPLPTINLYSRRRPREHTVKGTLSWYNTEATLMTLTGLLGPSPAAYSQFCYSFFLLLCIISWYHHHHHHHHRLSQLLRSLEGTRCACARARAGNGCVAFAARGSGGDTTVHPCTCAFLCCC